MENILFETENNIATITLNRPEVRNAMDEETIAQLHAAFDKAAADETVRVLVLRGEGKAFCAGGDLNWMRRAADFGEAENIADAQKLGDMLYALHTLNKPTIALVHGAVYGGGVGLVCACDVALGLESSKFCLPEAKIGLIPSVISPYVIAATGQRHARRLFMTAEVIEGVKAQETGLLHEVFSAEKAQQEALESLLATIKQNSPNAMGAAKEQIFKIAHKKLDESLVAETTKDIATQRATAEAKEGVSAFLEKRKPDWVTK